MYESQSGGVRGGNSPGSKQVPRSSRAPIPLRPVTIRMILEAQRVGDGAMIVSGQETGVVTLAGRIVDVVVSADNQVQGTARSHTYRVTDGTGVITVRHWLDQAPGADSATPEALGSFIAATGTVKVYQDKPTLTGSVRLITDVNEFTYHLLECVNTHLRLTLGDRQPAGAKAKDASGGGTTPHQPAAPPQAPQVTHGDSPYETSIHRAMMSGDRGAGITPEFVQQQLANQNVHISVDQIKVELDRMVSKGFYFQSGANRYAY